MSADDRDDARSRIEAAVAAVPGVVGLYPLSPVPGAPRARLRARDGAVDCELRLAVDAAIPSPVQLVGVAAAVRGVLGEDLRLVRVEIASIE